MAKLKGMFNGFWRYRYLLWNLVSRDFKLKYRRSVLGVLWSVLNPLLMCLVYWAVFSSLMDMRGSGIDNFPVFLMCGQLLFNFFNEATSSSMSSVLGAASLLKKVYIPKYVFPLEKCGQGVHHPVIAAAVPGKADCHNERPKPPFDYDLRSRHAALLGGSGDYLCTKQQELDDITRFMRSWRD